MVTRCLCCRGTEFRVFRHFCQYSKSWRAWSNFSARLIADRSAGSFDDRVFARLFAEPVVYHGMSLQFRFLTRPNNDLSGQFDAVGMNGNVPFLSFDPRANGVSNASVFHRVYAATLQRRWGCPSRHQTPLDQPPNMASDRLHFCGREAPPGCALGAASVDGCARLKREA